MLLVTFTFHSGRYIKIEHFLQYKYIKFDIFNFLSAESITVHDSYRVVRFIMSTTDTIIDNHVLATHKNFIKKRQRDGKILSELCETKTTECSSGSRGGQGGHAPPPPRPVKNRPKKDGHHARRLIIHVSWPPPFWSFWIRYWNV